MAAATNQTTFVSQVTTYVREFMGQYDGSHDFHHIQRVLGLALNIAASSPKTYDLHIVTLSALLHDVGDRKYLRAGDDAKTMVYGVLKSFGADEALARKVQTICSGVSYSTEITDFAHVQKLLVEHPELGPVQDADRLDAIGAVGIGRAFTFGGAHGGRPLSETLEIFTLKLEKLEALMKTERGKELARRRTERLEIFKEWLAEEYSEAGVA